MEPMHKLSEVEMRDVIFDMDLSLNEEEIKQLSLADVKVPFIMKNKRLLSPGIHNGFEYTPELIKRSVEQTQFTKDNSFLNLNHEDNSVEKWVGEVKNVYWNAQDGSAYGDLWFIDPITALKLQLGAKFGISIKGKGNAMMRKVMELIYQNFGVVINPACKTTFLNSEDESNSINKGEIIMPEIHKIDIKNDETPVSDAPVKTDAATEVVKEEEPKKMDTEPVKAAEVPETPKIDSEKEELKAKVAAYEKEKVDAEEAKKTAELESIKKELQELKESQKKVELQSKENAKARAVVKPITTMDSSTKTQEDALKELSSDELDEAFAELVMSKATKANVWKA
jgi:hypothetical protein